MEDTWNTRAVRAEIRAEHHVRIEHRDQAAEVARARGGKESVHDLSLPALVLIRCGDACHLHAPSRPTRELPRGRRRLLDHGCDLLKGQLEHVVQDERQPLRRRQRVEHDEQRQANRVRQQRLLFRLTRSFKGDQRVRQPVAQRVLGVSSPGTQHVQADARHDRRQPAAKIGDLGWVRAAGSQP